MHYVAQRLAFFLGQYFQTPSISSASLVLTSLSTYKSGLLPSMTSPSPGMT